VANEEVVQRWTAKRRAALVLSIIRGESSTQEAARRATYGTSILKTAVSAIPP